MTQSSPEAARFAPNGNPFTALVFLDFNSMYLWSQLQVQPLTPGLRWVKMDLDFKKEFCLQIQASELFSIYIIAKLSWQ